MPMTDYGMPPPPAMQKRKVIPPPPPPPAPPVEGFDAGDGVVIPPLPNNPYAVPKENGDFLQSPSAIASGPANLPPPPPGANAGGGPTTAHADIQSDIFRGLYRAGKRADVQPLMDMARPPVEEADPFAGLLPPPLNVPQDAPRYVQAQPMDMPGPMRNGEGLKVLQRRFPKATSLIPRSAPPVRGGY